MNKLLSFTFYTEVYTLDLDEALTSCVSGDIRTTDELFQLLCQELKFPSYFGYNWNALLDCLRDFSWVNQRKVIIVHDDLPGLEASELKTYLEILHDAVLHWARLEPHCFEVAFKSTDRKKIGTLLNK